MKMRTGFVSNSSSSSFVICGFQVETDDPMILIQKLLGITKEDIIKKMEAIDYSRGDDIDDGWISDYCCENIDTLFEEQGFDIVRRERGNAIVGKTLATIGSEDGGYLEESETDMKEILESLAKIKEKLKLPEEDTFKIFTGTENC
jgi:hypothetical protein